jgi:hypothetical protein
MRPLSTVTRAFVMAALFTTDAHCLSPLLRPRRDPSHEAKTDLQTIRGPRSSVGAIAQPYWPQLRPQQFGLQIRI